MKKLFVCIAFVLFHLAGICQDGVKFEDLTLEQALTKAKAENKLVLMDCYTSWCGPCKMMASRIFTQKEAGDFFNPHFISVKYDMEKGEGIALAKKYNVKSFPTFFIIRPDGTVQHRIGGGAYKLEDFIAWIKIGLNEKTSLDYLEKRYATRNMTKQEMADYHWALFYAGYKEKDEALKKELLASLDARDKLKEEFWFLMEEQRYGSSDFQFVVDHVADYRKIEAIQKNLAHYLSLNYAQGINRCLTKENFKHEKEIEKEVGKIRKEVTRLGITDENVLRKIKLTEAALARNSATVVSILEASAIKVQAYELRVLMAGLDFIVEAANEGEKARILALGDKLVKRWPDEGIQAAIKSSVDRFRDH